MNATKTTVRKASISEKMVNDDPKLLESFDVGDVSHQGDLIFVRIASLPASAKCRPNRQLADGNTQGSRHILARGTPYDANSKEIAKLILSATKKQIDARYIGPVFVSPAKPSANDLTHPEHGNQGFPAKSICAVVYQRNLDSEEREQRVQD